MTKIIVLIFVVLLTVSGVLIINYRLTVKPSPSPTVNMREDNKGNIIRELKSLIDSERLDREVYESILNESTAEGFIVFDSSSIDKMAEKRMTELGIKIANQEIIDSKSKGYTALKSDVFNSTKGSFTVIQDYEVFATEFVRFNGLEGLLKVLKHPSVQAIRANKVLQTQ